MSSNRFLLSLAVVSLLLASAAISWLRADAQANIAEAVADKIISTAAGGGLGSSTPAMQAPISLPTAVTLDTQGRGLYFIDDFQGSRLLRFLNTSPNTVTLAGTTILTGQIGLIAGGGNLDAVDGANPREVYLGGINGMVVNPSGNLIFFGLPILSSGNVMAVNLGTQPVPFGDHPPIQPGKLAAIVFATLPDMRTLALGPNDKFYTISTCCGNQAPTPKVFKILGNSDTEVVAGGGDPPDGGNGDGGPANQARIINPTGIAFDSDGNLLIAEGGNSRNSGAVRKVTTDGFISSIVSGLGFLANYPVGITIGPTGAIYVAMGNGQRIVQVNGGSTTPIAGDGSGFSCVSSSNPTCGDGGPAISAALNLPGSSTELTYQLIQMAADVNGLFFPDGQRGQSSGYAHIRYVNRDANPVTIAGTMIAPQGINSVAGSGKTHPYDGAQGPYAILNSPHGVAVDALGNLFISDTLNHRLRFVNRGTAAITMFAGTPSSQTIEPGAIATLNRDMDQPISDDRIITAFFDSLQGLAANANGIFISDAQNGAPFPGGQVPAKKSGLVRFLNTSGSTVTFYPASPAPIQVPPGQVKVVGGSRSGPGFNPVDIGDGGLATAAVIFTGDVAVDGTGNIFVADYQADGVRKINSNTGVITTVLGGLNKPTGVAVDPGGRVVVADTYNNRVLREHTAGSGTFSVIGDSTLIPPIQRPRDIAVDGGGRIYVVSSGSNRVLELSAPGNGLGTTTAFAGSGATGFGGDGGPALDALLNLPNPGQSEVNQPNVGIAILSSGIGLVFADTANDRIRQVGQEPRALRVLGSTIIAGSSGVVSVNLDSLGDENGVAFSLNFDATRLTFVSASLASGLPQGSILLLNPTQATSGRIGVLLSLPLAQAFTLGAHQLVTLTFNASVSSPVGSTAMSFGDVPVARELVRADAASIPLNSTAFSPGSVTIIAPVQARNVRAIGSTIRVGAIGSVMVEIDALANENGLAFSLTFDSSKLTFVSVVLGSGAPGASLNINNSQATTGQIGIAFALPANQVLQGGTRQVVSVVFSVVEGQTSGLSSIGFGDVPVLRELVDTTATSLPVNFTGGSVIIEQNPEGDMSPRPTGNGTLSLADWVQAGRFAVGLDVVSNSGEFQRADCAPRDTRGNGVLSLADWVQAGRYATNLDPVTPAGGPSSSSPLAGLPGNQPASAGRERTFNWKRPALALSSKVTRNGLADVALLMNATGVENAVSFSISVDPLQWELLAVQPGRDAIAAKLILNESQILEGRLGVALAMPPGQRLFPGRHELVVIRLRPTTKRIQRVPRVELIGDRPVAREVADVFGKAVDFDWAAYERR